MNSRSYLHKLAENEYQGSQTSMNFKVSQTDDLLEKHKVLANFRKHFKKPKTKYFVYDDQ